MLFKNRMLGIVLSTHNSEVQLKGAIKNIQNQIFEDWLLIICDNGLNEKIRKIVFEKKKQDERIIYFSTIKVGKGATYNRNSGIVFSRLLGLRYTFILDDDDRFSSDYSLYELMKGTKRSFPKHKKFLAVYGTQKNLFNGKIKSIHSEIYRISDTIEPFNPRAKTFLWDTYYLYSVLQGQHLWLSDSLEDIDLALRTLMMSANGFYVGFSDAEIDYNNHLLGLKSINTKNGLFHKNKGMLIKKIKLISKYENLMQ